MLLSRRYALMLFWTCVGLLLLIVLAAPRGCSSSRVATTADKSGDLSVEFEPQKDLQEEGGSSADGGYRPPEVFAKGFSKKDWLFVVYYQYEMRADLSYAPVIEGNRIRVQVSLPGQILSANANRIERGNARWDLALGKTYKMDVTSRYLRWWLIVLVAVVAVLLLYSWISLRKSGPNRPVQQGNTAAEG